MKKNDFNHQDWEPVVLRKSKQQLKKENPQKYQQKVVSNKKCNNNQLETKKIKEEDDFVKIEKKISHELKIAIQQARTAKGLNQKDFAAKLGVQPSIVKDYEAGKVVPNGALLAKMSRILGVKLKK
ncbi:Helix-turn-helix [seawater metagenome]|uniref:Helix-turn-helix n=1 Tax=seawater metagenome TaxID=1561972 RepID=A0A5E8CJ49_9ZZZZ